MMPRRIGMLPKLGTAVLALIVLEAQSRAAILWCSTKVSSVAVNTDGWLNPSFEGMGYPVLCSVNGNFTPNTAIGTITPEVCKAWFASLTTALISQKPVLIAFDFGASLLPACNAVPNFNWGFPTPFPYWLEFAR